jgi:hypothetical protein
MAVVCQMHNSLQAVHSRPLKVRDVPPSDPTSGAAAIVQVQTAKLAESEATSSPKVFDSSVQQLNALPPHAQSKPEPTDSKIPMTPAMAVGLIRESSVEERLTEQDKALFVKWSADNARRLDQTLRAAKVIIIDDPQPCTFVLLRSGLRSAKLIFGCSAFLRLQRVSSLTSSKSIRPQKWCSVRTSKWRAHSSTLMERRNTNAGSFSGTHKFRRHNNCWSLTLSVQAIHLKGKPVCVASTDRVCTRKRTA